MSLYHFHTQVIGRSSGKTATAAIAYRATCKLEDRTTGEHHDYTRKEKALYSEIIAPDDAPEWCFDRQELWNRVQENENRKNSTFCREYEVALQSELSLEDNIEVVKNFIKFNFKKNGLVADFSIHAPHKNKDGTDNKNLHAHILVTARQIENGDWAKQKFRTENVEKVLKQWRAENGNKELHGQKADKIFLEQLRKDWADTVNFRFQKLGMSERIDHRTLEEQGIDREPQIHQGAKATAMERKGKNPDRKRKRSGEVSVSDGIFETMSLEQIDAEIGRLNNERKEQEAYELWKPKLSKMSEKEFRNFEKGEFADRKKKEYAKASAFVLQSERKLWIDEIYACSENLNDRREMVGTLEQMRTRLPNFMNTENPYNKDYVDAIELSDERCSQAVKVIQLTNGKPNFTSFLKKFSNKVMKVLNENPLFAPFRGLRRAVDEVRSLWQKVELNRQQERQQKPQKNTDWGIEL